MITARAWAGKRYAVLGLARSGAATVEALLASGAQVTAWDEKEAAREALSPLPFRGEGRERSERGEGQVRASRSSPLPASLRSAPLSPGSRDPFALRRLPASLRSAPLSPEGERALSFADPLAIDLAGFAGVVVSPGVPLNRHPIAAHAARCGVPVIGDIELFAQARPELPPHKVVGITGTNGKSTTTALVHHILQTASVPTAMGGNIGLPILAQDPLPEGGVYVLELSSYQIDLTHSLDCDVAVLLNVTPDHLDRYDSFETYAASKMRLFEMQSAEHCAINPPPDLPELVEGLFSPSRAAEGGRNGLRQAQPSRDFAQADWPALQGPHNAQNAAAAIAVAQALGLGDAEIEAALRTYSGLPHRMERVRERAGVLFVNDSKATNPESAAPALAAYPYIHWIVGGRAKGDSLGPCAQHLDHVRAAYTIGEAGPMFARLLEGRVKVTRSGVLSQAVTDAAGAAVAGEVVLLSPACASFDQFRDYEARGDAFRAAVEALP